MFQCVIGGHRQRQLGRKGTYQLTNPPRGRVSNPPGAFSCLQPPPGTANPPPDESHFWHSLLLFLLPPSLSHPKRKRLWLHDALTFGHSLVVFPPPSFLLHCLCVFYPRSSSPWSCRSLSLRCPVCSRSRWQIRKHQPTSHAGWSPRPANLTTTTLFRD